MLHFLVRFSDNHLTTGHKPTIQIPDYSGIQMVTVQQFVAGTLALSMGVECHLKL